METARIISLLFFALVFMGFGCEDETIDSLSIDSCRDFFELEIEESCDFTHNRNTVERFKNAKGIIEIVELKPTYSVITIRPDFKNDKIPTGKVVPCNLPSYTFKEGQELIFSGNLKEIFPYENIIGPQIEISSIKIRCEYI